MSNTYLIEVTEDQLRGLKHAVVWVELEYRRVIPEYQVSVARWTESGNETGLSIARKNLEYIQKYLPLVVAASPAVFAAKLVSPSPAPSPLPETAKQAAPSSPPGGERGMLPPALHVRAAGGSSDESETFHHAV